MGAKRIEISLFPLSGTVLFPTVALPLQIFEPRYLEMVADCQRKGESVGILLSDRVESMGGTTDADYRDLTRDLIVKKAVCGVGHIEMLSDTAPHFKSILVKGWAKVELVSIIEEVSYSRCFADIIEEKLEVLKSHEGKLTSLREYLGDWLKESLTEKGEVAGVLAHLRTPQELVNFIAVTVIDEPNVRQFVLEQNDINERIEMLLSLLGSGNFSN